MDLSIVESHRGKSVVFVGETRESEEQDKVPNENGEVSSEDEDKANNEEEDDEGNEEERESDDSVSRETGYRKKSLGTTFLKISLTILSKFRLKFKQIHSLILLSFKFHTKFSPQSQSKIIFRSRDPTYFKHGNGDLRENYPPLTTTIYELVQYLQLLTYVPTFDITSKLTIGLLDSARYLTYYFYNLRLPVKL